MKVVRIKNPLVLLLLIPVILAFLVLVGIVGAVASVALPLFRSKSIPSGDQPAARPVSKDDAIEVEFKRHPD